MSTVQKVNLGELRRLIDEGLSTKQIAAHFGVQSPAITRQCRQNDIPLPHGGRKPGGWAEPTRADDERELGVLRRVVRGFGIQATARRFRMSSVTVQAIVRRVRDADLRESGEPPKVVAMHYVNPRGRG